MFEQPSPTPPPAGPPVQRQRSRWPSLSVVLLSIAAAVLFSVSGSRSAALPAPESERNAFSFPAAQDSGKDFSKFSHREPAHTRLPCLLCHRRETTAAQPKRSGHTPCAGCHVEQFARNSGPICTICHSGQTAGSSDVKPFPKLASFDMKFDHSRHKGAGCATCHKPTGRGNVALSIPSGPSAHNTCYQCHTPRAQATGRDISSCGTCHSLGAYSRTPVMAKAFQVNFSHAEHSKQKLDCSECHQVKAGQPQRRQVSAPVPAMHLVSGRAQSCMSCHNGKRAFGDDNFSNCQRCHEGQTFRFQ